MQVRQKIKFSVKLILIVFSLIVVVAGIRFYLIESVRISTPSMRNTLKEGDFILVNKWDKRPDRNRVTLFVSPLQRDSLSSPLFLSRCIGLPGDTIQVSNDGYTINGHYFPLSPNSVCRYQVDNVVSTLFFKALKQFQIPARDLQNDDQHFTLSLTPFEEYSLREELPNEIDTLFVKQTAETYTLVVPRKNRPYKIDPNSLVACQEAVRCESDKPVSFRDGKLYLDGKETDFFFFSQDYYWMLSDNVSEGIDSRHLGFIPADNIRGTAWICWYSQESNRLFKTIR